MEQKKTERECKTCGRMILPTGKRGRPALQCTLCGGKGEPKTEVVKV